MIEELKKSVWNQFGASIDTLENAISLCPDSLLEENKRLFYIVFHTLIFLDYYSTFPPKDFQPRLPLTITEPDKIPAHAIDDLMPNRFYNKKELLDYLLYSRKKCKTLVSGLTEERVKNERFIEDFELDAMNYSILEILLYSMRHVQHHAAQINLILRQEINTAPNWVFEAKDHVSRPFPTI